MPKQGAEIYQLKISLERIRPPIWRRVLVADTTTLGELHQIIQIVMDWDGYHLHAFTIGETQFGPRMPEIGLLDFKDENALTLREAFADGKRLRYEYDFGDSWRHLILLEKRLEPDPNTAYPQLIKGKRAAPEEDSGGVWGYESSEDDEDTFDLEAKNKALGRLR